MEQQQSESTLQRHGKKIKAPLCLLPSRYITVGMDGTIGFPFSSTELDKRNAHLKRALSAEPLVFFPFLIRRLSTRACLPCWIYNLVNSVEPERPRFPAS